MEIDAKKSLKAENDLRNQLKRVESRNQSLEANFQNQDRIIKQLLRDMEAMKNSHSPQDLDRNKIYKKWKFPLTPEVFRSDLSNFLIANDLMKNKKILNFWLNRFGM